MAAAARTVVDDDMWTLFHSLLAASNVYGRIYEVMDRADVNLRRRNARKLAFLLDKATPPSDPDLYQVTNPANVVNPKIPVREASVADLTRFEPTIRRIYGRLPIITQDPATRKFGLDSPHGEFAIDPIVHLITELQNNLPVWQEAIDQDIFVLGERHILLNLPKAIWSQIRVGSAPMPVVLGREIDTDLDGWCMYNAFLAAFGAFRPSIETADPATAEARAIRAQKFAFLIAQHALHTPRLLREIDSYIRDPSTGVSGLPKAGTVVTYLPSRPRGTNDPEYGYETLIAETNPNAPFIRSSAEMGLRPMKFVASAEDFLKGLYTLRPGALNATSGPIIWGDYILLKNTLFDILSRFNIGLRIRDHQGNGIAGENDFPSPSGGTQFITLQMADKHYLLLDPPIPPIAFDPIQFLEQALSTNPAVIAEAARYGIILGGPSLHTAATGLVNLVGSIAHHIDPRPPIVKAAASILGVVGATASALGAAPSSSAVGASGGLPGTPLISGASGGLPGAAQISGASSTTSSTLSAVADVARQHEAAARVVAEEARRQEDAARAAVAAAAPGTSKAAAEAALTAAVARREAAESNLTAATRTRIAAEAAVKAKQPAPLASLTAPLRSRPAAPAIAAAAVAGGPPPPGADPAVVAAATAAAAQANNTPYVRLVAALRAIPERPPISYKIPIEEARNIANLAAEVSNAPPQGISSGMRDLVARLTRLAQPAEEALFTDTNASSVTDLVRKAYSNRAIPTQADAARTVVIDALTTVAAAADLKETPDWASSIVPTTNIKPSCVGAKFITPDCVAQGVQHSALVTNEIAQVPHSVLNASSQAKYNADPLKGPATHAGDLAGDKLGRWIQLSHKYADRTIQIRDPVTGHIQGYTVSNPYRAKSYRDRMLRAAAGAASFGNPTGTVPDAVQHDASGGDHPENVEMWQQNALLLSKIAPPEMIADTKTAVALLESLWFCGSSASLATDPRCFPARALGELREYQRTKAQQQHAALAKKTLEMSSWDRLKRSIGIFTDPFTDALPVPLRIAPPTATDTKEEEEPGVPPPLPTSLRAFQEYAEKQASAQKQFRERIQAEIAALKADLARRGAAPAPVAPPPTPVASPAGPARLESAASSTGAVGGTPPASPGAAAGAANAPKPRIPPIGPRRHGVPDRFGSSPAQRGRIPAIMKRVPAVTAAATGAGGS